MFITLDKASKSFDGRPVLNDVSLTVSGGERICLYGPSGCGKTTLLRIIAGLEKPDAGEARIRDGLRFSVQFQEDRLLPWFTVLQNLTFTERERGLAEKMLAEAGLADAGGLYPEELSGGMKRRVSLLRALADDGDALLLDEPLRELDAAAADTMIGMIDRYAGSRALVLVTHERAQAERLACRVLEYPDFQ